MSQMRCCHCGRRIVRAAGMTSRGPVGPVCAAALGLPRPASLALRVKRKPRNVERSPVERDERTRDWVTEAAC